jgi:glycine oxidase
MSTKNPLNIANIGIAGAGLLGRLLALTLVQQGHSVTLFDQDSMNGKLSCGMSAAGMLTPFAELDSMEPSITEMGIYSLKKWPLILSKLKQKVYFQQMGSLMLAHAQDRDELNRFKKLYEQTRGKLPCLQEKEISVLDSQEIQTLEPELGQSFQEGLYFPSEGQICPSDLFSALAIELTRSVTWHEKSKVTAIKPCIIECLDNRYTYDWVFDCRGLGSKPDYSDLRGVRGELIELYAPGIQLNRIIRLMHPRYALYIAPRPQQRFIIGASSIESEDHSPISVQTTLELLSAAYSLHRGFAEARIIESRVNCRPAFSNNLPKIETEQGLTRINGLYRHGYLLAPYLVEEAVHTFNMSLTGPKLCL